ncbi:helix-turn-helix transcriptional regulator [Bacillus bombysepticus]|uniref:helix-turn-helix domain-containing protein n=1 Tax=Bacillus bombysepticus TaxID=658666 RepID=UPI003017FADB
MNWETYKKGMTALTQEEIAYIELKSELVFERIQQGLTQHDMAKVTGLTQSAIARFESHGCSIANMKTILKYSRALGKELTIK